jgi:hypothetical protein
MLLLTGVACDFPITEETERNWQMWMPEALVPGHLAFRGIAHPSDTDFFLFTYRLPEGYDPAQVVPLLKGQIQRSRGLPLKSGQRIRDSCFTVVRESTAELLMRCSPPDQRHPDQWHILVDPVRRKVTALRLDSGEDWGPYLRKEHAKDWPPRKP